GRCRDKAARQRAAEVLSGRSKNAQRVARWKAANPEGVREHHARHRRTLKGEAFDAYGGACQCCGENERLFLTLDHVKRDGARQREALGKGWAFWRSLRKRGYPQDLGLRVLCHNCHHVLT